MFMSKKSNDDTGLIRRYIDQYLLSHPLVHLFPENVLIIPIRCQSLNDTLGWVWNRTVIGGKESQRFSKPSHK